MSYVLSGNQMKAIATASPTAEATMLNLAVRRRMRSVSDLRRTKMELVKQNEKVVEQDFMKFWKDLEAAGVGCLVYGRNGNPDRFEWYYNLKTVAKAAIDGTDIATVRISEEERKADLATEKKEESKPIVAPEAPKAALLSLKEKLEQRSNPTRKPRAVAQTVKREAKPVIRRGRKSSEVQFTLTKSEVTLLGKILSKIKK